MNRVATLAKQLTFDALVLALVAFGQLELWSKAGSPRWLYVVALAFTTGVLLFRRLNMLGASLLVMVGASSLTLIDAQLAYDTATIFFAVLLATWTIASHAERLREAVVGWFAAIATAIFVTTQFPEQDPGDYFWIPAFFTATWLAGWAVNHRGRQARGAVERARHERETAVADERRRIARELHDVVAHSVSVMTVQAGAVRRLLHDDQGREREALLAVEETGRTALAEMRRLLGMLREGDEAPSLAPLPGIDRLDALVQQVRDAGLPVEVTVTGEPVPLPPGIDVSAFRIVQEALTNALKHAGPARAFVDVRWSDGGVELEIANDGAAEGNGDGTGHGLIGMQERVALYGGELEAGPRRGGGYTVRVRLPVTE